ncbi:hypothetical protein NKH49_31580 [Mesorhizobium sp. M1088]
MVIRREAGSALPDSYDTERRPLIHGTLAQALARLQKWFKDPAKSLPPQIDLVEGLRGRQVALAQHNAFRSHREHRSRGVGAGLACCAGFAIHPHLTPVRAPETQRSRPAVPVRAGTVDARYADLTLPSTRRSPRGVFWRKASRS